MKPDFSAQTGDSMTAQGRREWSKARVEAMKKMGATWFRFSVDDEDNPKVSLVEGWRIRPEGEPKPEFHIVAAS